MIGVSRIRSRRTCRSPFSTVSTLFWIPLNPFSSLNFRRHSSNMLRLFVIDLQEKLGISILNDALRGFRHLQLNCCAELKSEMRAEVGNSKTTNGHHQHYMGVLAPLDKIHKAGVSAVCILHKYIQHTSRRVGGRYSEIRVRCQIYPRICLPVALVSNLARHAYA